MSNHPGDARRASRYALCAVLLLAAGAVAAADPPADDSLAAGSLQARVAPSDTSPVDEPETPAPAKPEGDKKLLGISILGNQEAPKALVLVPWKSSQLGDTQGLANSLDDSRRPVDREVFQRELAYYEIREGSP